MSLQRLNFDINIADVQEYNESLLIAKCNIFHAGLNRNGSIITQECADNMVKKISYIPVVGEWKEQIGDFGGHGGKIEITDTDIKFVDTTTVFGCVLDEPVFKETYGDKEYYCCKVALYKEKFPQLESFINKRKGQSMEINVKDGAFNDEEGVFYINQATMTALCILGDDVEPCFAPSRISTFSLEDFEAQYQQVLCEVKKAFAKDRKEDSIVANEEKVFEEERLENDTNTTDKEYEVEEMSSKNKEEEETKEEETKEEETKEEETKEETPQEDEESKEELKEEPKRQEDEEDEKNKHSLSDEEVFALIERCSALEKENKELREFKLEIERAERITKTDKLFANFDLDEEEIKELRQLAYEAKIELDVVEGKLFELVGRKLLANDAKFSSNENMRVATTTVCKQEEELEKSLPYGSLNKYFKVN